jgi:shikimate kinase
MGSGKTTLGKALAAKIDFKFLDTDEQIVQLEKRTIEEIFENDGEGYFRTLEFKVLDVIINTKNNLVISTGGGFPCFNENMDKLLESGFVVYLSANSDTLYNRLKNDRKRPLLKFKSDLKLYIETTLKNREQIYQKAHLIIDSSELPFSINQKIFEAWKNF